MATYSICPVGFPDKESTALEAIFTIASSRMRNHWHWVAHGNADVYMVWADSQEQWSGYQAQQLPKERMLAFILPGISLDARWQIQHSPGRVPSLRELIQALDAIGDELAAGVAASDEAEAMATDNPPPAQTAPPEATRAASLAPELLSVVPLPPAVPAPVEPTVTDSAAACFDPDRHLLGLIRLAQADGVPRRVVDEVSGAALLVDAAQEHFFAPGDSSAWLPLLSASRDHILAQPMDARQLEAEAAAAGFGMKALDDLIFLAALMGSQGRLWVGADTNVPVHLKRWPNLKSMPQYSDYVGLVAFMNGNTADLKTIAERTGLPLGKVIDFHNGCMALDLLEVRDATEIREKAVNPALRSLFGKIAQRLRDVGQDNKSDNLGGMENAGHRSTST
jgi:hypothetical protein